MKDLVEKTQFRVKSIIKKITGEYNEDLEQEVYIRTIKNIHKYQEKNKFTQWVSTITANICRDYLKSSFFKNSQNAIYDESVLENLKTQNTPEKIYSQNERQKIILHAIDCLPKKMREVIILYEFENYSYEKIAKKLNIPEGTVKSRINNARKILKDALAFLMEEN